MFLIFLVSPALVNLWKSFVSPQSRNCFLITSAGEVTGIGVDGDNCPNTGGNGNPDDGGGGGGAAGPLSIGGGGGGNGKDKWLLDLILIS